MLHKKIERPIFPRRHPAARGAPADDGRKSRSIFSSGTRPWRLALCLALLFFAAAPQGQSARREPSTLPLGAAGQSAPGAGAGQMAPAGATGHKAATASPTRRADTRGGQGKAAGIQGFSDNPFDLEHKKTGTGQAKADKSRHVYGKKQDAVKPLSIGDSEKLTVTGKKAEAPKSRLTPDRRVFSGGEHTLSRMDEDASPEVRLNYQVNKNATTSLVVNPQDEASPLPRPPEQDGSVNAAGFYVNMDVAPDVKLRVGGEYCTIDDPGAAGSESSRGAAVGLEWNF